MAKKRNTGFGVRLRALREAAGLSRADLAARAGMAVSGLVKLETGAREPSWSVVLDLARALVVEPGAFVYEGAPPEPPVRLRGRPRKPRTAD